MNYNESESFNAMIPVRITKGPDVQIANPVTFRVSPLTVANALARSLDVPAEAQVIDIDSPIQASKKKKEKFLLSL